MRLLFTSLMAVAMMAATPSWANSVAQFAKLADAASSKKTFTTIGINVYFGKWQKFSYVLDAYRYDVGKTDSLLNPMVGLVWMTYSLNASDLYENEQAASVSTSTKATAQYNVKASYHHDGKSTTFQYKSSVPPRSLDHALKAWLPKQ
jgi:hypothetical protein